MRDRSFLYQKLQNKSVSYISSWKMS